MTERIVPRSFFCLNTTLKYAKFLPSDYKTTFLEKKDFGMDNITKTFTVGKLTEHQYAKLVIAGELLDIFVTTVFPCEIVEIVAIDEV